MIKKIALMRKAMVWSTVSIILVGFILGILALFSLPAHAAIHSSFAGFHFYSERQLVSLAVFVVMMLTWGAFNSLKAALRSPRRDSKDRAKRQIALLILGPLFFVGAYIIGAHAVSINTAPEGENMYVIKCKEGLQKFGNVEKLRNLTGLDCGTNADWK